MLVITSWFRMDANDSDTNEEWWTTTSKCHLIPGHAIFSVTWLWVCVCSLFVISVRECVSGCSTFRQSNHALRFYICIHVVSKTPPVSCIRFSYSQPSTTLCPVTPVNWQLVHFNTHWHKHAKRILFSSYDLSAVVFRLVCKIKIPTVI